MDLVDDVGNVSVLGIVDVFSDLIEVGGAVVIDFVELVGKLITGLSLEVNELFLFLIIIHD